MALKQLLFEFEVTFKHFIKKLQSENKLNIWHRRFQITQKNRKWKKNKKYNLVKIQLVSFCDDPESICCWLNLYCTLIIFKIVQLQKRTTYEHWTNT